MDVNIEDMENKRYLVTGGTGFIGSALVESLVRAGNKVKVLDNNSRGRVHRLKRVLDDVELLEGDIRDYSIVSSAVKGSDVVCHLAYINGTEFFYEKPDLVLDVGVKGMVHVLDACKEHGVVELITASSSEVYQTPPLVPTDETVPMVVPDPMNPRYSYGGGKLISELMTINYGRVDFNRVMIFRPHNVYGKDMGFEHVIPQFAMRAAKLVKEQPEGVIRFPIQGDGTETRAFVHIDDFTKGLMSIIEKGEHLNIYHIGNDEEISIRTIVDYIFSYYEREYIICNGALLRGSTHRRCPDIGKLKALGYSPRINLFDGIQEVIEWYEKYVK